jgi:hypothetical protein
MKADCTYDSTSGKISGTVKFVANNVLVAEVALSSALSGISNTNLPVLNLVLSCAFGTGNAGNTIVVQDFCIAF